jgi:ABC-type transport system involved in multi-copper enzyme maturation permease subunit
MKLQLALNPVLVKELRGRMRGARAYVFLTVTLLLLGGVSYGLYRFVLALYSPSLGGGPGNASTMGPLIGQCVFVGVVFLALALICAVVPALTASAISSEHERKTFDLLIATPLRPASILFGKLIAALSYVFLILLAAVPLVSVSFVFGGVPLNDMLQALLLLLGFALTYSVIGLFFSSWFRRTTPAVAASYLVVLLFTFITGFIYIVTAAIQRNQPPAWLLILNPFSALASALVTPPTIGGFSSPLPTMQLLWFIAGGRLDVFSTQLRVPTPLWYYTVSCYGWLTILLYLLSAQLVKPVGRFRVRSWAWLFIGLFLLASLIAAPFVYARLEQEAKLLATPTPAPLVAPGRVAPPPPPMPTSTPTPSPPPTKAP